MLRTNYNPAASLTAAAGSSHRRDPRSCRLTGPHYCPTATTQSLYENSSLTAHAFSW